MRWKGREQSDQVEDRRGRSAAPLVGGGIGTIIVALIAVALGADPAQVLSQLGATTAPGGAQTQNLDPEALEFVSVVLKDTEDVWTAEFKKRGLTYEKPKLVLFTGQVNSACGTASSAVGPFYCPGDKTIYLDTEFYSVLKDRLGAPGEFARAYVIAHEVGHHVQNLLGTMDQIDAQRKRLSEVEFNKLSVRLELQADYYAGAWAHHAERTKDILDPKDLEEAIRAAEAIGDDTLQKQSQGHVVPDAFTHGTSDQRVRWFNKGWESGRLEDGDTFRATRL